MAVNSTDDQATIAGALPSSVVSPVDLGRLLREIERLDEATLEQNLRHTDQPAVALKTSKLLEATAELNKINLLDAADRKNLQQFLLEVRSKALLLHMSFSADPSPLFIDKLIIWLRREIHPVVLLTIGLQPNIGAGCIVRTANRYFDFSLRKDFEKKGEYFIKSLEKVE